MLETLMAWIKAMLWRQGDIVAQDPHRGDPSLINLGKRVGGTGWVRHPPPSSHACS